MPDQKLITTSTGQQLIVSSAQNTVLGTTSGIKPVNISKTYGRKVIAINSQQSSAAQQAGAVKLSTGQTLTVSPSSASASNTQRITLADMVGSQKKTNTEKMVISSAAGNISANVSPKVIQGYAGKQAIIGNVVKSGGNLIKVVQGTPQTTNASANSTGQSNTVKIISNKTVQLNTTTGEQFKLDRKEKLKFVVLRCPV